MASQVGLEKKKEVCREIFIEPCELSQQELQRIASVFSAIAPVEPIPEECFKAALNACKKRQWLLVEEVKDSLDRLVNFEGFSILQKIICDHDFELARGLVVNRISFYTLDSRGDTALHYVARTNEVNLFEIMSLKTGIDIVNVKNKQRPLHVAAAHGNDKIVAALLKSGADVNAVAEYQHEGKTFCNVTALDIAIMRGHKNCIDQLNVKKEVDFDESISGKGNSLRFCCSI